MNHVLNSYHCKLSQKLESIINYPCSIKTFLSYIQFLFKICLLKSRLVIFNLYSNQKNKKLNGNHETHRTKQFSRHRRTTRCY